MDDSLNILKQFEAILKKGLQEFFGSTLPEDKIALLNKTNYINLNEFKNMTTNKELQGHILRKMLNDLIDLNSQKEIEVEPGKIIPIQYGESLQQAVVEYYAKELSEKYHFDINELPLAQEDVELVVKLKELLDKNFDEQMVNNSAENILKLTGLKTAEKKLDEEAIKKYFKNNSDLNKAIADNDTKKQEQIIEEYTTEKGRIQFVYLDNELYFKYIDGDDKVHLVKINQDSKVLTYYKDRIASLQPGQELDSEVFFREISELISEETLTETKDIKPEDVTHEEVDMLKYVSANKEVHNLADDNSITHTDNAKIHVIEKTNDVVTTENKGNHVEGEIIKDQQDGLNPESIDNAKLSPQEYEELLAKYARGETTKEEEDLLMNSSPYLLNSTLQSESGPKLTMNGNKSSYGIANNKLIIYLTSIGLLFVLTIIYILIK